MDGKPPAITFRVKRARRRAILIGGILLWVMMVVLVVTFALAFKSDLRDVSSLLGEDAGTQIDLLSVASIVLLILMTFLTVYGARYWSTYRVVLDESGISREGVWHPLDPKVRVDYAAIERVERGTRYVIRIVPTEGKVLSTNLKILEGEGAGLIEELRTRLGDLRVPPELEVRVHEKRSGDTIEIAFSVAIVGFTAVYVASLFQQDRILALYAWKDVVPGNRKIVAFDLGRDDELWALSEGKLERHELGLRMTHLTANDKQLIELPLSGLAREVSHPYDPVYNSIVTMAVDDHDRLWVLFEETEALHYWNGERWKQLDVRTDEEPFYPRGLARVGSEIWGITRGSTGVIRIDSETLDTFSFEIQGRNPEDESIVTLDPRTMTVGNDGGVVIAGILNLGYPGIAAFNQSGEMEVFIGMDESTPVPDDSWGLAFAGTDGDSNLYAAYTSRNGCVRNTLSAIVGVWEHELGEWTWGQLNQGLDCSEYWTVPSFAVDPHGRTWMQFYSSAGGSEVLVYERDQWGMGGAASGQPMRRYTELNSHYIGEELQIAPTGRIYAIDDYGGAASWIDASAAELPNPAPGIFGVLWDRSYIVYAPMVALGWIFALLNVRKNRKRW